MTKEALDRLRCVEVLADYIETEISSYSLSSKAAEKLRLDVAAIPGRCRALFVADAAVRTSWPKRKKKR